MGKKKYFAYIVHTKGLDSDIHPGYHMGASTEVGLRRQQSLKALSQLYEHQVCASTAV